MYGCHFDDLPDFLCGEEKENVVEKVRAHFAAIEAQGAAVLPECKIGVLGNGGVGKTSLVRALKGLPHRESQTATEGIRLWSWDGGGFVPFPGSSDEKVQLNVWDFGGQDLYHNTHRMFLESRAIFLVVWRQPRSDGSPFRPEHPEDPVRPLNYWLDQVFAANPKAPVILVRTGMDEDAKHRPEDWKAQVREEYRSLPALEVSARDRSIGQLKELRDALRESVVRELRSEQAIRLGRGRRAVRDELRQWQPAVSGEESSAPPSARPLMRVHEFASMVEEVFRREGLEAPPKDEPLLLLDYLHNCGALYCPPAWHKSSELQGAFPVIVDQRWAIEGIYEPFRPGEARDELVAAHGKVTEATLDEVWEARYDAAAQWVFVRFMLSCGVLVRAGSSKVLLEEEFILPELLPGRHTLERLLRADPLVARTLAEGESRDI